jgi:tetratricopeptide (TPR) repeat protein
LAIRLFHLLLAIGNIYLILACLRLVFPEHPRRWILGLLMAGFLPMHLYYYQYPSNHVLGGTLASLAIYLLLRVLCHSRGGAWNYVALGLCLGLALLSIVSVWPLVALVLEVPAGRCERSMRHYLLGMVLARQKHTQDARQEFQTALRLFSDDPDTAEAYAYTVPPWVGPRAAIDAWRNVLRINPDSGPAHAALARLYVAAGDPAAARRHENYLRALEQWDRRRRAP